MFADVMNSNIKGEPLILKGVSRPPCHVVLLQDKHTFTHLRIIIRKILHQINVKTLSESPFHNRYLCEERCCSETSQPRPNYDVIDGARGCKRFQSSPGRPNLAIVARVFRRK